MDHPMSFPWTMVPIPPDEHAFLHLTIGGDLYQWMGMDGNGGIG